MNERNKQIWMSAVREAYKNDWTDYLFFGSKYFSCGYSKKEKHYNYNYAVIVSIIGRIYGTNLGKNSDYHNGIAYISSELGISKRQVKSLRKQYDAHGGHEYKTPYVISKIIELIIKLLQDNASEELINDFLKDDYGKLYRDVLINKQYGAIKNAASVTKKEDVLLVEGELNHLTQIIGG